MKRKPQRAWLPSETTMLNKEMHSPLTVRQIAERHGRTEKSVYQKISKIKKAESLRQEDARSKAHSDEMMDLLTGGKQFEPAQAPMVTATSTDRRSSPPPGSALLLEEISQLLMAISGMVFIICVAEITHVVTFLNN